MRKKVKKIAGWREVVALPDLSVSAIKAKLDTGARTSSLHITNLKIFEKEGKQWARFNVHPRQKKRLPCIACEAQILEFRDIKSSNGHISRRPVIETRIVLDGENWISEITLMNREKMNYRMLLGRKSMKRLLVDSTKSYLLSEEKEVKV
tara:strand:- start:2213 stop:2662 length:450 start_codon:yes stop_codon:yes gene_type:complete